jgi:hypothetical protein
MLNVHCYERCICLFHLTLLVLLRVLSLLLFWIGERTAVVLPENHQLSLDKEHNRSYSYQCLLHLLPLQLTRSPLEAVLGHFRILLDLSHHLFFDTGHLVRHTLRTMSRSTQTLVSLQNLQHPGCSLVRSQSFQRVSAQDNPHQAGRCRRRPCLDRQEQNGGVSRPRWVAGEHAPSRCWGWCQCQRRRDGLGREWKPL